MTLGGAVVMEVGIVLLGAAVVLGSRSLGLKLLAKLRSKRTRSNLRDGFLILLVGAALIAFRHLTQDTVSPWPWPE